MRPLPWSFSALDKFETCPRQYYHIKVVRDIKEEEGEAAKHGNIVHDVFEGHLKDGTPLTAEMKSYEPYLEAVKRVPGERHVELKMALNNRVEPCDYNAKDVWVRGKCDTLWLQGEKCKALDHKTGKRKPASKQMKLMALLIFYHYPQIMEVETAFMWLKFDVPDRETFLRNEIPELWNEFLPTLSQYRDAFKNNVWQPRQSGLCAGWCPVSNCEFWRPKRIKEKR